MRQGMKKAISLVLIMVMVFAMSLITASAAGEGGAGKGTITLENPQKDKTYTAYKIFDVTYSGDHYSYTIKTNSPWFEVVTKVEDSNRVSNVEGLKFTKVGNDVYQVELEETETVKFSAAAFAETLKENVGIKTGTPLQVKDGKASVANLDLGYYFVTTDSGALCNLTTTDPTATIYDKNDVPFDKKVENASAASADIGEKVTFTITGKVPDTTGFETYTYEISDKMTDGLTFNNDVKVFVDGEDLSTADYTLKTGDQAGGKDFVLNIDVKNLQTKIGKEIKVTYTATVNEKAITEATKNTATLSYGHDPKTAMVSVPVYSCKVAIDKYKEGEESTKLEGAAFILYKEVTEEGATEATKQYYKYTAAAGADKAKVEWVADKAQATAMTTDTNGAASFEGLAEGTYYLEETQAPSGYIALGEPKTIVVQATKNGTGNSTSTVVTAKVPNAAGNQLPETGGMGTTIFYVVGGLLVAAAVVLLVARGRVKEDYEKK